MWPFRRKALRATGGVTAALEQGWTPWPLIGGGNRQRVTDIWNRAQSSNYSYSYTNSPAVRTCVDLIARNVGQLDLRLYEEISESERVPKPDHPAALSMRYPNDGLAADQFIRELFIDYLIHDNCYALLVEGSDGRLQMMRIPAFMVVVQGANLWQVDNYRVWPQGAWQANGSWGGGGTWTDFLPEQVMHWHGVNPVDPRIGLSLLDTIKDVVAEDAALQAATVELAQNGLQEPIWMFRPLDAPAWSTAARRAHEEDVANRMRERNKKPVILEEGMEIRSFGMSPRDAQMVEQRKWAIERVAALYGIPLGMVGLADDVTSARQEFLTDTLPPITEAFTRFLNQRLLVQVYGWTDGCFEFNLAEKSVNADERIKTLVSATGRPVMLTNEARAKLNLPPVEDGDELVTPMNVVVGEKPSPQVMPIQDPNRPPQDGSYRLDQGPTPVSPGKALQRPPDASQGPSRVPQLLPRRAADIERQYRNIDVFLGVVQKHFNRLERSLEQKARTDWARWDREFAADINKALRRTVQAEGDIYMIQLASSDNFDMGRVQNYLLAMAEGAAAAINETIRGEIADIGLDSAMARAPQHVSSSGTSLGARSTVWTREEAARQSGSYEQRLKSWVADTERHAEFDGDTVAIGDEWPAGFAPGSAPNCACSMTIS